MDILAPAESRFPLAAPRLGAPTASASPGSRFRPFGLRFYVPSEVHLSAGSEGGGGPWQPVPFRYCERQQVAVADDGSDEPMLRRVLGWDHTTTGNMDGNEEWKLDYTASC